MKSLTLRCAIENLTGWHPKLFVEPHVVAFVAVLSKYSRAPVEFEVECVNISSRWLGNYDRFQLHVSWRETTARKAIRLRSTLQTRPLIEMAAAAVALLLANRVVHLGQLEVTDYGNHADFRSLDVPNVLEVSGTELPEQLERRHREKVAQALSNPFGWDAYVAVCAFSTLGHRVRFSKHRFQEPSNA